MEIEDNQLHGLADYNDDPKKTRVHPEVLDRLEKQAKNKKVQEDSNGNS